MSVDPTQPPGPEQQEPAISTPEPEQPGPYYEFTPSSTPEPQGNPYPPPPPNPYMYPGPPQDYWPAPSAPNYGRPLSPLPLVDAIAQLPVQFWKILSQPGPRAFAEESGKAKWNITLVMLIGYTVLDGLLGWLQTTLHPITAQSLASVAATSNTNGVDVTKIFETEAAIVTFANSFGLFFLVPLGFFAYQGIAFGIARAFGGQGSFLTQSYTSLLVYLPVGLINIALAYVPIPVLPALLSLGLDVYGLVLAVFAMMGAHRLTGGKASATALLPFVGLFLLACCAVFIALIPAVSSAAPPQ
ncbi:MAG TPA: Yip1 family protein [Ktedonobacterales bacterium]|nr:Yip1 family protein [Ktedonobacterales bacterium]